MGLIVGVLVGCDTPRKNWTSTLEQCGAASEIAPLKDCIYFGTSSGLGPGTVLVRNKSGYTILFRLADVETNEQMLHLILDSTNIENTCSDGETNYWSFDPTALVSSTADTNINANLSIALNHAKNVTYNIKGWRLDTLNYYPFIAASTRWDPIYKSVLNDKNAILITSAYKIEGFKATYQIDSTNAVNLGGNLATSTNIAISKVLGANANISWADQSHNTLQIETDGFYVFGQPSYFDHNNPMYSGAQFDYTHVALLPTSAKRNAKITVNMIAPAGQSGQ